MLGGQEFGRSENLRRCAKTPLSGVFGNVELLTLSNPYSHNYIAHRFFCQRFDWTTLSLRLTH